MRVVPLELSLVAVLLIPLEHSNHDRDLPLLIIQLCVFINRLKPGFNSKSTESSANVVACSIRMCFATNSADNQRITAYRGLDLTITSTVLP